MTGNKQSNADKSQGDADRSPVEVERKHHMESVKSALEKADPVSQSVREALERSNPLQSLRGHDDILGSMLDRSNALGALVNFQNTTSLHDTVRALTGVRQHEAVLATALDDMARIACTYEDANRLVIGPLRELETSITGLSSQAISMERESLRTIATQAAFQFRMPELNETARLPAEFQSRNESVLGSLPVYSDSIKTAMDAIREPWINVESASRSISAFCELYSMATHLIEREPYEDLLVGRLRQHLV